MAKRFYPQQYGDRKKPKLDISISDHNFPLSQSITPNKESSQTDTWGDDNEDEMLLLASQACEDAYNVSDISQLPNYSMCMQPPSTSTQFFEEPSPSTSNPEFTFKKPLSNPPSTVSTRLKDRCNIISSPLPGISAKLVSKPNGQVNVSDDFIFNDKIYKGQDSDIVYRQLLQLQEENAKLKSENGKLLEKCVTKEGESSILRTQLKNCQMAVDNARLEKIKAQEKVQMEWTDKLTAANNQMQDLRTQLDFKNLEIISVKEKCKKFESSKVKLTQVTVGVKDTKSNRWNSSHIPIEPVASQRRVKTSSNAVQTDRTSHILKINKTFRSAHSKLSQMLPHMVEVSPEHQLSVLDYNEKLQKHLDLSQNKCRIFSTYHRVPPPGPRRATSSRSHFRSVCEDISCIAAGDHSQHKYFNIMNAVKSVLEDVRDRLEMISQRMTTAFQKEMDEKYIEATSTYIDVQEHHLWMGKRVHKEEQEMEARRLAAALACLLATCRGREQFASFERRVWNTSSGSSGLLQLICRICALIDATSCATLYSGLLLAFTHIVHNLNAHTDKHNTHTHDILRSVITSRPMQFVSAHALAAVAAPPAASPAGGLCRGTPAGNLRTDHDQGVLLYKKESCALQVLLKQIETCLKCMGAQELRERARAATAHLMRLHAALGCARAARRCDCNLVLVQVIVYALRTCAVMLAEDRLGEPPSKWTGREELAGVCRCGVRLLHQCAVGDVEFSSQLSHNEGHLIQFCEIMRNCSHDELYSNMLSELAGSVQPAPEARPPPFHAAAWRRGFLTVTRHD